MAFTDRINARGHDKQVHPLSHHEILGLTEPFIRRGRHVELAASDRINRRLVFKPIERSDDGGSSPTHASESLALENPRPELYRLIRTLTLLSGLEATLQTEGRDPSELLARIEMVPWQRQFCSDAEVVVAQSYRLVPSATAGSDGAPSINMELTRGEAEIKGFTLVLHAETVKGYPADIDLAAKNACVDLPDDLLAVIGWGWGPLRKTSAGWNCKLRVTGKEPQRSRQIEAKLARTVTHLRQTMAKPPDVFHDAQLRARWGVTFRRAMPLLFVIGLIAGAGGLCFLEIPQDSVFNLLIQGAPPLLLFAAFGMRDTPHLEFPPLPRRPKAAAWQLPLAEPPAAATTPDSPTEAAAQPVEPSRPAVPSEPVGTSVEAELLLPNPRVLGASPGVAE